MAKTRIIQILKSISDGYYANQLVKSYNARINGVCKANPEVAGFELSGEELNRIKDFWGKYKIRPNIKWIKAYSYAFGKFSEKFLPDDVYFLYVEPYLNNLFFSAAFSDCWGSILTNGRSAGTDVMIWMVDGISRVARC